jgi:hypothetical protein
MNKCYRCKETKPIEEMSATTGFCKPCKKAYTKEYNLKNREKNTEYRKTYVEKNKEVIREKAKDYTRKPQSVETRKAYKEKNKEKIRIARAEYNSRPEVIERNKLYKKEYAEKHKKEKVVRTKADKAAYKKYKRATDINYRLKHNLRNRLNDAIKRKYTKSESTLKLLGCNVVSLRTHLESKFLPTMSWNNYGTLWHIDHILPCASFDLSDAEQQKKCFHYSNLQPLFAITTIIDGVEYIGNLNKQDKIIQLAA